MAAWRLPGRATREWTLTKINAGAPGGGKMEPGTTNREASMFNKILLATDGSPASTRAAELAVGLARTCGAKLAVVYVVDPYPYLGVGDTNPLGFQAYMSAAYQHAAQARAKVEALVSKEGQPVELLWRLAEDKHASEGILQAAAEEGADLIVVGSHGRRGIGRWTTA